jgi:hypothetical protein
MKIRTIDRLTYANVIATLALFVSLGGASHTAIKLPADSVSSRQLRPGVVNLGALNFPLGTTGMIDNKMEYVPGVGAMEGLAWMSDTPPRAQGTFRCGTCP